MNKEAQTEKPFYQRMPESDIETIQVEIKIPKQYFKFWKRVRALYGLPEDALNQIMSEELVHHLNMIHDEISVVSVIGIPSEDIKDELVG